MVSAEPTLRVGLIELLLLASSWGLWRELQIHPLSIIGGAIILGVWIWFHRIPLWLLAVLALVIGICTGALPEAMALLVLAYISTCIEKEKGPTALVSWVLFVGAVGVLGIIILFNASAITVSLSAGLSYGLGALVLLSFLLALQAGPKQRMVASGWLAAAAVGFWGQWLGIGGGFAIWLGLAGFGAWGARLAWNMPPVRSLAGILVLAAVVLNGLAVWSFRSEALLETAPELVDVTKREALLAALPSSASFIFAPDSTGAQFALYLNQPTALTRPSVASLLAPEANGKLWIANAIRAGYTHLVVRTPALEGYEGLQPYLRRRLAHVGLFQVWELNPNYEGAPARGLAMATGW